MNVRGAINIKHACSEAMKITTVSWNSLRSNVETYVTDAQGHSTTF